MFQKSFTLCLALIGLLLTTPASADNALGVKLEGAKLRQAAMAIEGYLSSLDQVAAETEILVVSADGGQLFEKGYLVIDYPGERFVLSQGEPAMRLSSAGSAALTFVEDTETGSIQEYPGKGPLNALFMKSLRANVIESGKEFMIFDNGGSLAVLMLFDGGAAGQVTVFFPYGHFGDATAVGAPSFVVKGVYGWDAIDPVGAKISTVLRNVHAVAVSNNDFGLLADGGIHGFTVDGTVIR